MDGSFNLPPLIIRSSRTTSALMLLIAIGFVAAGVVILRDPNQDPTFGYLGIVFFGAGVPLFLWRLIRPDTLMLAPDGITWHSIFKTHHYKWDEVQGFRPYSPSSKTISKHLGFDFTDNYQAGGHQLRGTAKTLTGVEGSLGGGWEISAAELADLLHEAQARWLASSGSHQYQPRETAS
jgi:hypothetical protein